MHRIHTPERLRALTGINQTDYDSWRRTLDGAPPPHALFTDGDVLAYRVVSFLIHDSSVALCVLKHLAPERIFEACNIDFRELKHWRFMYNVETNTLSLLHKDQPDPAVKYSARLRKVPLEALIEELVEEIRKTLPLLEGEANADDEAALYRVSEQLNANAADSLNSMT